MLRAKWPQESLKGSPYQMTQKWNCQIHLITSLPSCRGTTARSTEADKEATQCSVLDHPARGHPSGSRSQGKGHKETPQGQQGQQGHHVHKGTHQTSTDPHLTSTTKKPNNVPSSHKGKVSQEGEEDHNHPGIWTSDPEKHK